MANMSKISCICFCVCFCWALHPIPSHSAFPDVLFGGADTLNTRSERSNVGGYQWEHLWKRGSIGVTTRVPTTDFEVFRDIPPVAGANIAKLSSKPDLSSFRLIAIGGSLASGVRDGGVYRAAQLTAYPNLIARQMGVSFRQPLFSESQANGSGYNILINQDGPVLQYETVGNNLAFDPKSDNAEFTKEVGDYDNLAMPFFNIRYPWKTMDYYDRPVSALDEESTDFVRYFKRITTDEAYKNQNMTYLNYLRSKPIPDFIIYDLGMDAHLKEAMIGGYVSQLPMIVDGDRGNKIEFWYMNEIASKGAKGVVVTIPDVIDFPYFQLYGLDKIKKIAPDIKIGVEKNNGQVRDANSSDILLPTGAVLQLFSNPKDIVLKETDVIAIDEDLDESNPIRSIKWYNDYYVKYTAKKNNFAVFDLYGLFKKITDGEYTTHDGIRVDPTFPKGNFYSSDAIHPTAFGQAVIANECIQAINSHYGSSIPFISTVGFLKSER